MKLTLGELANIINNGISECHLSKNNDVSISMDLDEDRKLYLKKLNIAYLDNKTLILSSIPLSAVENGSSIVELTTVVALKNYIDEIISKDILTKDDNVNLENGTWFCENGEMDEDEYFDYGDSDSFYISTRESFDRAIMRHGSLYLFHVNNYRHIRIGVEENENKLLQNKGV